MSTTLWTVAHQVPLSMDFSRQEYWNGWPFPSQRELPDPGIEPGSPALQVDSFPLNHISYLVPYQFLLVKEAQEHCSVTTLQSWSWKRASTKAREIINEVHNFQWLNGHTEMRKMNFIFCIHSSVHCDSCLLTLSHSVMKILGLFLSSLTNTYKTNVIKCVWKHFFAVSLSY